MDIAASTAPLAAPKPAFESFEGALRRLSAADLKPPAEAAREATPTRHARKGQALDIRV